MLVLVLERRLEKGEGRDMDVDIDPNDDKASQGDDAEPKPHPHPRQVPAWEMETGPSAPALGYAAGDQGGNEMK